ncbi:MAG TPA: hypothetical protein VKR06_44910 [Ktedonosporobacter sp.]|nr:hypothetical protein [Ktedonosporobacter sp.]
MQLTQHPEYQRVYLPINDAAQRCQQAIANWKAHNDTISVPVYSLHWTYESARSFVRSLSNLFQAYNRILWRHFHYCRQCGGQCCVMDASDVRPFDLLALALLDQSVPSLPENITATGRQCLYLSHQRCSWPAEWGTIKCWSFYCLGVGPWQPGSSIGQLRAAITAELQVVVRDLLPPALRSYEAAHGVSLADTLDDPVYFAHTVHNALSAIFVAPFDEYYPIIHPSNTNNDQQTLVHTITTIQMEDTPDDISAFIAEAAEQICECPLSAPPELTISSDQFLQDLESLQWIIEGQPSHTPELLQAIYLRYINAPAPATGEAPTLWYRMRTHLLELSSASTL